MSKNEAKEREKTPKKTKNKMILDALRTSFCSSTKVVLASASPRRAELLRQLGIARFEVRPSSFAEDLPKTLDGASYARATAAAKAREVAAAVAREREQEEAENGGGETTSKRVLIIAADTVVEVDSLILEKPSETDGGLEGKEMLRRLSGREHRVSTGVALVLLPRRRKRRGGKEENETQQEKSSSFSETTLVRFAELPESEIDAYVASGENLGKAGGYGIQVRGGRSFFLFFSRRSGSFLSPSLSSLLFSLFDLLFYHQKQIDQGPAGAFVEGIQGCYFNVVGLPLHSLAREVAAMVREEEGEAAD